MTCEQIFEKHYAGPEACYLMRTAISECVCVCACAHACLCVFHLQMIFPILLRSNDMLFRWFYYVIARPVTVA